MNMVHVTGYCPTHKKHEIFASVTSQPSATQFAQEAVNKGWNSVRTDRPLNGISRCVDRA